MDTMVPTDSQVVKELLRKYGEPITLFGECDWTRRKRLQDLVASLGMNTSQFYADNQDIIVKDKNDDDDDDDANNNNNGRPDCYPGLPGLKKARISIAEYSIERAMMRIDSQRIEKENTPLSVANMKLQEVYRKKRSVALLGSQVADSRPISNCHFSPNGKILATSSWSGVCKLWSIPDCTQLSELNAHSHDALCVRFHPQATLTQEESACNFATSGGDGSVHLWSLNSQVPIKTWSNKYFSENRLPRLNFHPSGRFIGVTCYDGSWRLFDLEKTGSEEVLHQECHNKEVFDIGFHPDGSLAASGSLDGYGILWDLRTGHYIMILEGHVKSVISVDFSPDGYHLATGSEDNTVKIWDLRQQKVVYTITGHSKKVSKVKFQPTNGHYLLTSSHDRTAKLWAYPNWAPIQTLSGHGDMIMSSDITSDDQFIATCSREKTFKIWSENKM